MLRPFRLVSLVVTLSILCGGAVLRFAAPAPAQAFGMQGDGGAQDFDRSMQLYAVLWGLANGFGGPGQDRGYPTIGRPGLSDSEMGRELSKLRSRQTGVPTRSMDYDDLIGEVQRNLKSFAVGLDGGGRTGPPLAARKTIRVGD